MPYTKPRKKKWSWRKDPLTGKAVRWQARHLPEEFLDDEGYFLPDRWYNTIKDREPAPLEDFRFHVNSQAADVGVSAGHFEAVVTDSRFHFYRIGPVGIGIRATTQTSASWFGEVRRAENREAWMGNLKLPTDPSSGSIVEPGRAADRS